VKPPRVLFILKFRDDCNVGSYSDTDGCGKPYGYNNGKGFSSGMLNSAKFVAKMLVKHGISVKLVQVADNNDIDREVYAYKPTHVIIEALWVVPQKFDVLQLLHPTVKWIVRGHSEIPFLANEGVAMAWLTGYTQYKNVAIAANSKTSLRDLRCIIKASNPDWTDEMVRNKVLLLPNYYPYWKHSEERKEESRYLDVGCFGAIRPLKNQLMQAVAAIRFAMLKGKQLRFHINTTRNEQGGNNVLKNIRALFAGTGYQLIEHGWVTHKEFLRVLKQMDILLQVSFSETFNIVAADSVVMGLPVVTSAEIHWVSPAAKADPTDSEDIIQKMLVVTDWRFRWPIEKLNQLGLRHYCEGSKRHWLHYLFLNTAL
jgi:hypothetical protein